MITVPFKNPHPFPVLIVPEVFEEATGEWIGDDDACYIIEPGETGEILLDPCKRRAVVGGVDVN